jgi:hypothetical protein
MVELRNQNRVVLTNLGGEAAQAGSVALSERPHVTPRPHRPRGKLAVPPEIRDQSRLVVRRRPRGQHPHPVDNQAAERQAGLRQPPVQEDGLLSRRRLR